VKGTCYVIRIGNGNNYQHGDSSPLVNCNQRLLASSTCSSNSFVAVRRHDVPKDGNTVKGHSAGEFQWSKHRAALFDAVELPGQVRTLMAYRMAKALPVLPLVFLGLIWNFRFQWITEVLLHLLGIVLTVAEEQAVRLPL